MSEGRVSYRARAYGSQALAVPAIIDRLHAEYDETDLGNQSDAVDELIFISLARQTHHWNALRSWEALQAAGGTDAIHAMTERKLARLLAPAGLSNQKARWIKESLRIIDNRFGELSLDKARSWSDEEVESFLASLPGISIKSAKCIMLYSMGRKMLPVDTHVRRVSERLGLLAQDLSEKKAHEALELAIPPEHRYAYHVNLIWHGRKICRAPRPACVECVLEELCPSADREMTESANSTDAT